VHSNTLSPLNRHESHRIPKQDHGLSLLQLNPPDLPTLQRASHAVTAYDALHSRAARRPPTSIPRGKAYILLSVFPPPYHLLDDGETGSSITGPMMSAV